MLQSTALRTASPKRFCTKRAARFQQDETVYEEL